MLSAALDESLALRGNEVMVDGAGGRQTDGIRNFANRWRISPLLERERDAVENALPPLDVVPGHVESPLLIGSQDASRTDVLLSNRSPGRWYHAEPVNLSSSTRYLRMARLVVKLPTYARVVWGIMRDPRTPIGLKGMLAAALAYVVFPIDLVPDAIPILGQADDLTVLLLVLDLFIQNAPPEVRAEHTTRAKNGTADLDRDLQRLRGLMGGRFDRIRDNLPELLDRYGRVRDPDEMKRSLAAWRRSRSEPSTLKELE